MTAVEQTGDSLAALADALDIIEAFLARDCDLGAGRLCAPADSDYAAAIHFLARHGRLVIESGTERLITARLKSHRRLDSEH